MGATEKGNGDTVRTRIIAPAEGLPGLPPPSDSSSGSLSDSELSDSTGTSSDSESSRLRHGRPGGGRGPSSAAERKSTPKLRERSPGNHDGPETKRARHVDEKGAHLSQRSRSLQRRSRSPSRPTHSRTPYNRRASYSRSSSPDDGKGRAAHKRPASYIRSPSPDARMPHKRPASYIRSPSPGARMPPKRPASYSRSPSPSNRMPHKRPASYSRSPSRGDRTSRMLHKRVATHSRSPSAGDRKRPLVMHTSRGQRDEGSEHNDHSEPGGRGLQDARDGGVPKGFVPVQDTQSMGEAMGRGGAAAEGENERTKDGSSRGAFSRVVNGRVAVSAAPRKGGERRPTVEGGSGKEPEKSDEKPGGMGEADNGAVKSKSQERVEAEFGDYPPDVVRETEAKRGGHESERGAMDAGGIPPPIAGEGGGLDGPVGCQGKSKGEESAEGDAEPEGADRTRVLEEVVMVERTGAEQPEGLASRGSAEAAGIHTVKRESPDGLDVQREKRGSRWDRKASEEIGNEEREEPGSKPEDKSEVYGEPGSKSEAGIDGHGQPDSGVEAGSQGRLWRETREVSDQRRSGFDGRADDGFDRRGEYRRHEDRRRDERYGTERGRSERYEGRRGDRFEDERTREDPREGRGNRYEDERLRNDRRRGEYERADDRRYDGRGHNDRGYSDRSYETRGLGRERPSFREERPEFNGRRRFEERGREQQGKPAPFERPETMQADREERARGFGRGFGPQQGGRFKQASDKWGHDKFTELNQGQEAGEVAEEDPYAKIEALLAL